MSITNNNKLIDLARLRQYNTLIKQFISSSDETIINSVKYYGFPGIAPSNQSLFAFSYISSNGMPISATLEYVDNKNDLIGDIVIPYEITTTAGEKVSVKLIDVEAFKECDGVTSITVPKSITIISREAFRDCINLETVTIPKSVASIEQSVFYNCNKLSDIYYEGSESDWNRISINSSNDEQLQTVNIHYNYTPVILEDIIDSLNRHNNSDENTHPDIRQAINTAISGVYKVKGSKTVAQINSLDNPAVGDVYNITDSGTIGNNVVVSAGDNIVFTSDGWDKLAASVDLSGCASKTEFNNHLAEFNNHLTSAQSHSDIRVNLSTLEYVVEEFATPIEPENSLVWIKTPSFYKIISSENNMSTVIVSGDIDEEKIINKSVGFSGKYIGSVVYRINYTYNYQVTNVVNNNDSTTTLTLSSITDTPGPHHTPTIYPTPVGGIKYLYIENDEPTELYFRGSTEDEWMEIKSFEDIQNIITVHNTVSTSHPDIREAVSKIFIGAWALTERVEGVSAEFKFNLEVPFDFETYQVTIGDSTVTEAVNSNEPCILPPLVFGQDEYPIKLAFQKTINGKTVNVLKAQAIIDKRTKYITMGRLMLFEDDSLSKLIENNSSITLSEDYELTKAIEINKEIFINLNGHEILSDETVFKVVDGGHLTITGNGRVRSGEGDHRTIEVSGGRLDISDGRYESGTGTDPTDPSNAVIYVKDTGKAYISGGVFKPDAYWYWSNTQKRYYAVNMHDSDRKAANDTGTPALVVTGGTFYGQDLALGDNYGHTDAYDNYYYVNTAVYEGNAIVNGGRYDVNPVLISTNEVDENYDRTDPDSHDYSLYKFVVEDVWGNLEDDDDDANIFDNLPDDDDEEL